MVLRRKEERGRGFVLRIKGKKLLDVNMRQKLHDARKRGEKMGTSFAFSGSRNGQMSI
jgi:hypothetical protein